MAYHYHDQWKISHGESLHSSILDLHDGESAPRDFGSDF